MCEERGVKGGMFPTKLNQDVQKIGSRVIQIAYFYPD